MTSKVASTSRVYIPNDVVNKIRERVLQSQRKPDTCLTIRGLPAIMAMIKVMHPRWNRAKRRIVAKYIQKGTEYCTVNHCIHGRPVPLGDGVYVLHCRSRGRGCMAMNTRNIRWKQRRIER